MWPDLRGQLQEQRIPAPRSLQQPTTTVSPFSVKRTLNSNSGKMVLWDTSPPSSWSTGFLNKVTIPCLNTPSLDLLACCAVSSTSLDSVTFWPFPLDLCFSNCGTYIPWVRGIILGTQKRLGKEVLNFFTLKILLQLHSEGKLEEFILTNLTFTCKCPDNKYILFYV